MPRYRFSWGNVPDDLINAIAAELHLRGDVLDGLRVRYGARPRADFVHDTWPILLSVWLSKDAPARHEIARALEQRQMGNPLLLGNTEGADAELAYLKSCRNAPTLREIVVSRFYALGESPKLAIPAKREFPAPGLEPVSSASDLKTRASDADREVVASALREHLIAGRITMEEFEERLGAAYAAATVDNLGPLLVDLPDAPALGIKAEPESGRARRKRERSERKYGKAMTQWEARRDIQTEKLELAREYRGEVWPGFLCQAGEAVFAAVSNTALIESRRQPGTYQGRSRGVSVPIGLGMRYRTGSSRGRYVQGAEVPTTIDTGTLFITNKRVVFQGIKQSRECRFDKTMGISHEERTGTLVVSVSNRQKPFIVQYGRKISDWVAFRLDLAMAHNQGRLPAFIAQLEQGLSEIDRQKPDPPNDGQPASLKGKRDAKAPTKGHVVGNRRTNTGVQRQPGAKNRGRAAVLAGLLILALIFWAVASRGPHNSYNDGYQWGEVNAGYISKTTPSCSKSEMVSSGTVNDPNYLIEQPEGDNEPTDNFAQWQVGCEAGAANRLAGPQ